MTTPCPYNCENKTELGYCRTTACINPPINEWSRNIPKMDFVAVVRCKDCEYYKKSRGTLSDFCDEIALARREDDFCSRGKRRKDG